MRRAARFAFVGLVVVGLAAGAAGILAFRLARGPLALDFLVPIMERALGQPDLDVTVRVRALELVWAGRRGVELRARDVGILGVGGAPIAVLPAVALRPSVLALLDGEVALRSVRLIGPQLRLARTPDGGIRLAVGTVERGESDTLLGAILADLRGEGPPGSTVRWLRRIEVTDGRLVVVDPEARSTWRARRVDVALRRDAAGMTGHLSARLALGGTFVPLTGDVRLGGDGGDVALGIAALRVDAVAPLLQTGSPLAAALARVKLPIDAAFRLALDGALRPVHVEIDATGGRGSLVFPETPAKSIAVESLAVAATAEVSAGSVHIARLALDLGGAVIDARGTIRELGGAPTFDGEVEMANLPTGALARYWPEDAAPDVRAWVLGNVSGGLLRETRVLLHGTRAADGSAQIDPSGSIHFEGLSVHLFGALPEMTGVAGTATMRDGRFDARVARGRLAGLEVLRATVGIDTRAKAPRAAIDGTARGPLAAALTVLDAEPLGYARQLGISPATAGGTLSTRLTLAVPLGPPITVAGLGITASGQLRGVSLPRVIQGWSVSGGDLDLALGKSGLDLTGTATLEGTPIRLSWHEDLGDAPSATRRVQVTGRITAAGRAALGLAVPGIEGPVDAKARLNQTGTAGRLDLNVDLTPATLALTILDLRKPAGARGQIDARMTLTAGAVSSIDDVRLRAGTSSIDGRATLANGRWRTIEASATIAPPTAAEQPGHFALTVRPASPGHRFRMTSDDAGALARALDYSADAEGGQLVFEGTTDLDAAGLPFDAQVDVRKFTLTRSAVLARIATLASLSGITNLLRGRGIPFDRVSGGLTSRPDRVTITDGTAAAPSIGLTVAGTFDRRTETLELRGTVVPSYFGLNRAPGRVPVLGRLVTGGGREGVQVIDFQVRGTRADPAVTVNPLTSLAPGVLRDLLRKLGR
jgi:uncharacterized protein YhdP